MTDEIRSDFLAAHEAHLSGCALRAADAGARAFAEPEHPYRTCYQRDRDRILHCSAFRRLDYKTQVFVPHEQDHYRTRLTHTLEVAQVARTLARALGANEDVAEAVALAHDLGHPPFGHAGEAVLNELMAEHGRFEHNRQTLRVVDVLEHPYPAFHGLNLTQGVRRCLAKHQTRYDAPAIQEFDDGLLAPLEGQLVDLADEIAYTSADLYDALATGWVHLDQLQELQLWRRAWARTEQAIPAAHEAHKRIRTCAAVLSILVDECLAETKRRIARMNLRTPADVQSAPRRCAAFGEGLAHTLEELQQFLLECVYRHPLARAHQGQARKIISELFQAYLGSPALLPARYRERIEEHGLHRTVCDYVAGMTDRFCRAERARIAGREARAE